MNKRAWVTGCAGLLGSHLCDALIADGWEVAGNDNFLCGSRENIPAGVDFIQAACGDIHFVEEMKDFKPDVVIHCAATAAEGLSVFSPYFITKNIAEASVATFSAAIAAGAKRIVTMSSMARYGDGTFLANGKRMVLGAPPFKEEQTPLPIDPYGVAKVYSEDQLKVLCNHHGVKWAIACPHNVIGVRQEVSAYRNVASIFLNRLALGKKVYIYGDGNQKRCFSPIRDCIPSIMRMVKGEADGEVVNIGPDQGEITINELLSLCEHVSGLTAERVHLPPRPLTDGVKEAHCSADKARRMLGYYPQQSLKDCLQEMWDNFKPKEFRYSYPLEIEAPDLPATWRDKL